PPTVKIRSVAAEAYESFAVDRRGHVWQWGNSQTTPARVRGWPVKNLTIVQLATSELHVLALALNGTAYAWGDNEFGQLGDGTTISRTAPVAVHMPAGVNLMTIGAGSYTSYAVDSTGSAWAWGDGDSGALGNGSSASSVLPLAVSMPAGVTFTQVLGSAFSGLALDSNGTAWSWGDNSQGTLGDGTTISRSTPGLVRMPAATVRSLAGARYAVV